MSLESYGHGATSTCRNGSEIPYSFKLILKIVWRTMSGSGRFLRNVYKPVCRNDSNDMPLERYRRDTTFSCRTLSLIFYGLRGILDLLKCGHSVFCDIQIDVGTSSD